MGVSYAYPQELSHVQPEHTDSDCSCSCFFKLLLEFPIHMIVADEDFACCFGLLLGGRTPASQIGRLVCS